MIRVVMFTPALSIYGTVTSRLMSASLGPGIDCKVSNQCSVCEPLITPGADQLLFVFVTGDDKGVSELLAHEMKKKSPELKIIRVSNRFLPPAEIYYATVVEQTLDLACSRVENEVRKFFRGSLI
jgi:hypothetical protein